MKRRRRLSALPLAALLLTGSLTACQPTVCTAVGFVNGSPIELRFAHDPSSVKACFGDGCVPAEVTRGADGRWLVPQDAAHHRRAGEAPSPTASGMPRIVGYAGATSIRVVAVIDGTIHDAVHEIPTRKRHPEIQCSPEYDYLAVEVG